MLKKQKDTAWLVANGLMTKMEASRKLKVAHQNVNAKLFDGLVETLKDKGVITR